MLNRKLLGILCLGFSSGLPLALVGSTFQAWYKLNNISIASVGFLTLIGVPYTYKFLWAVLLDKYTPYFLGRRRGWIVLTQLAIIITILIITLFSPATHPILLALLGLILAFFSATQDIVIDAYKAEIVSEKELGLGAALGVEGYRIAMLTSGGLALILADYIGFKKHL